MMKHLVIDEAAWSRLNTYLEGCVERHIFPGADFAVVGCRDAQIIHVGNRQITPSIEKNDHDTLWDLASVSKVVSTTTCILKLMEEGLINQKTKISDILPEFERKEITIRHCLTHSSGMCPDIEGYKQMTTSEICDAIYHMPYAYEIGTKVVYSDINFILLGWVVAKLKGSLDGYAKEAVFTPLGMTHTCYCPTAGKYGVCAAYEDIPARGGIIRGTVHDGKAHMFGGVSGHAGVFSTVEDLIRFVQMLLNDGMCEGRRFFHEGTIALLRKCQTEQLNERRSVGWVISDPNFGLGDYFSDHTLFHTGFSGCSIMVDLDRKVAFINCCNRVHPTRANRSIYEERNNIHNLAYQCISYQP